MGAHWGDNPQRAFVLMVALLSEFSGLFIPSCAPGHSHLVYQTFYKFELQKKIDRVKILVIHL